MDALGILLGLIAGFLLGAVTGTVLGLWLASGATQRGGAATLASPSSRTDGLVTKRDLEGFQLELEDMYEKLRHLYDRTRKRVDREKVAPGGEREQLPPAALPMKERKMMLRRMLAERRAAR